MRRRAALSAKLSLDLRRPISWPGLPDLPRLLSHQCETGNVRRAPLGFPAVEPRAASAPRRTYGIAVLLGPDYLGVTGVMTQISMMIPVLLIGLAIDYAIHLTARYREDLAKGATPAEAAKASIGSVGGALVLAPVIQRAMVGGSGARQCR